MVRDLAEKKRKENTTLFSVDITCDLACTAVAAASCWQDACQGCMRPTHRAAELSRDGQLAIHGCFACFKTGNFAHLHSVSTC